MYNIFYSCKLRFNEFTNEISEKKLKIFCSFSKGKGISKAEISSEGTPCIRYGELYTHYNEKIENISSKTDVPINSLVFADYGDIIIPTSGETAIDLANASCIYEKNVAIGGDTTIIKTSQNGLYLSYYITSKKREIAKLAQGVSIVHLYASDLKEFKVNLPSKNEQDKIATFLSLIDRKIELLEKTLNLYQIIKLYFLNNLFTQKLKIKNKSNQNFEVWKKIRLGEVISLNGGYAFKSEKFKENGIPIIRISNISNTTNFINNENLVYYSKINNDNEIIVKKGDLIIAMSGATTGKVSIYNLDYCSYINQRVGLFKKISKCLNYSFLIQYCFSNEFKSQMKKVLVAGAQPNISKKEIENFKIILPSLKEQKMISDLLNSLDKKIFLIQKQFDKTNNLKRGLLQQMFI